MVQILFLILLILFSISVSSGFFFVSAQIIKQNHNNKNTSTNSIPQIYHSQSGGEIYRFNKLQPNDLIQVNETEDPTVFSTQNPDKSWKVDSGKTRIEIFTKNAGTLSEEKLKAKATSWNYEELEKIGYWLSPKDWKNVEFTLIFKFDNSSSTANNNDSNDTEHDISIVTRSLFHDSESAYSDKNNNNNIQIKDLPYPYYCGGSSYHNNISNDHVKMKKE